MLFNKQGDYLVTIKDAKIVPYEKDGEQSFQLMLYGETEDGYGDWGNLWYNKKINTRGTTGTEVSNKILEDSDVPDRGYIGNIPAMIANRTLKLNFSVHFDDKYQKYTVKYVNPPRLQISKEDFGSFLSQVDASFFQTADKVPAFKPNKLQEMHTKATESDDLPF
jgi:hypothetical protein